MMVVVFYREKRKIKQILSQFTIKVNYLLNIKTVSQDFLQPIMIKGEIHKFKLIRKRIWKLQLMIATIPKINYHELAIIIIHRYNHIIKKVQ